MDCKQALPAAWCEKDLLREASADSGPRGVDAALLKPAIVTRKDADKLLAAGTGSEIKHTAKHKLILTVEHMCQFDWNVWLSVEPRIEQRLRDVINKCLPTVTMSFTIAESCAKLTAL